MNDVIAPIDEFVPKETKELKSVETVEYSLCVFQCSCGFHIGLDASYLDAVDDIQVPCPNCKVVIDTAKIEEGGGNGKEER